MRAEPIARLENGQPLYTVVPFYHKGKPTEYCVQNRRDGAWMMPRTTDMREAAGICSILSSPGDVPLVTVSRHDVQQMRLEAI